MGWRDIGSRTTLTSGRGGGQIDDRTTTGGVRVILLMSLENIFLSNLR